MSRCRSPSGLSELLLAGETHDPRDAVWDDADGDQRHGGALAERQQVEEGGRVCRRLDGIEQVQQHQRDEDTAYPEGGVAVLFALGVQRRVQSQAQTEQRAHVTQQAGERRRVHVHPGGVVAPFLGFLQGPQQIDAHGFEEDVEGHGGGQEEQGDVEVPS